MLLHSLIALFLIFTTNTLKAQNFYVEKINPENQTVSPAIERLDIKFNEPITDTLMGQITNELKSKITINPQINCNWMYTDFKTITCYIKNKLLPKTTYDIQIKSGLAFGKNKLPFNRNSHFKTMGLSIVNYKSTWKNDIPTLLIDFNLDIEKKNISGSILCANQKIETSIKILSSNQIEIVSKSPLKKDDLCTFSFEKGISLIGSKNDETLDQKILIHPEIQSVIGNKQYEISMNCSGSSNSIQTDNSLPIPQLACEYRDSVMIYLLIDQAFKDKLKDFIQIIPKSDIQINEGEYLSFNFNKKPNQNYLIKIKKDLPLYDKSRPLDADIIFQLESLEGPYILGIRKQSGVIERLSPQQLAYSNQNIQKLTLNYDFFSTEESIRSFKTINNLNKATFSKKYDLVSNTEKNQSILEPIDIKSLAEKEKVKSGIFAGNLQATEISENVLRSTKLLRPNYDDDRKYSFNYLITNLGLHVKKARKGTLVWAFSLNDGKPVAGAEITITPQNFPSIKKVTDKQGLASFEDLIIEDKTELFVFGKHDEDVSYIATSDYKWREGISSWDFNLGTDYSESSGSLISDVVAERPLYLPGEEVRLKIFLRKKGHDEIDYQPIGQEVTATIVDSRQSDVTPVKMKINKYGTATFNHQLPVKAPTGQYSLKLSVGSEKVYLSNVFQVEEFRKPEFKVTLSESNEDYNGVAKYFKGGGVQDLEGEVVAYFQKLSFSPKSPELKSFRFPKTMSESYDDYFEDSYYRSSGSLQVLERTNVTTDSEGKFNVNRNDLGIKVKEYGRVLVEANFQDANGGNISGRVETRIAPLKLFPGIKFDEWYYNTGKKFGPKVVVLDPEGKPHHQIEMILEVNRIDWIYERRLGSGNYFYYDSRMEIKKITECKFKTNPEFKSCEFNLKDNGYYEFKVSMSDGSSDSAQIGSYVYESGGYMGFSANNNDRINLNVENRDLKLGDTVKFMAISPLKDAEALITLERDGILYKETVNFKGNVLLWEKKIEDEAFIPGFYISAVIIKGRTSDKIEGEIDLGKPAFKIGYAKVNVENSPKRLRSEIKISKPVVEPGKMVEADIELKDHLGKPVKGEFAIAVVDDALLSLSANYKNNYDILDTFYSLGNLGVSNYQTLTQLIGRRTFGKKGANAGGGGGAELRTNFQNTALWLPQVETEDNGKYHLSFKVPDNLTTWKIIAISVDDKHRFGFAENEFLVSKPLMIEPAFPNFLISGDKFNAKVSLTNRTGASQKIEIKGTSKTFKLLEEEKSINLDHNKNGNVSFKVETKSHGNSDIAMTAKAKDFSDGFKINIPVLLNSMKSVKVQTGILKDEKTNFPISIEKNAFEDSIEMNVNYSSSIINGVDEVFRYILHYPYGCWEQQLTAAYFLAQYEQFKPYMSYRFEENKGSIKKAVQDILHKASEYQTESGGMRYYPGGYDTPVQHLSIFTGYAYAILKKFGYKTDPSAELKLKSYLKKLLNNDDGWDDYYASSVKIDNRAFILEVLDLLGEKNLGSNGAKLFSLKNEMDLFGLSFLAGFLGKNKTLTNENQAMINQMNGLKILKDGIAYFREPKTIDLNNNKYWDYTASRDQCIAVQNLMPFFSTKEEAAPFVRRILSQMKDGHWYNTQENIHCFEALRRYAEKFEKTRKEQVLQVKIDGKDIKENRAKENNLSTISIGKDIIKVSSKEMTLEKKSKDELYFTNILRFESPMVRREKINQGFNLTKTIYKMNKKGSDISWQELSSNEIKLKRGDILKIKLNVSSSEKRHQVMLNDSLAGCFEPINTQLSTTSAEAGLLTQSENSNEEWEWDTPYYRGDFEYMDLRLQAAQFYARKLDSGDHKVEYLVQTIATGEFTMPEATIEEMYYPEVRGTEKMRTFVVEE